VITDGGSFSDTIVIRLLTNCNIEVLSVAWRKTLRKKLKVNFEIYIADRKANTRIWAKLFLLRCEFGTCRLVRIVVYYPLFVIVFHYSMRFVVDHLILFARVLFMIRLDPFCCAVWSVIKSNQIKIF